MTNGPALTAALGGLLGWLASWRLPLPWFLPIAGRFEWTNTAQGLGIDLFGRALWLVAGAVLALPLERLVRTPRSESVVAWLVLVLFVASVVADLVAG